jgi:peptidoglycan/LPS O-acetylase OafA/YrhL
VSLGTVSYAVYIIHPGVSYLLHGAILGRQPSFNDWPSIFVTLLSMATVLLLAGLSWRFMEKPMIDRAQSKFRYSMQALERTRPLCCIYTVTMSTRVRIEIES